MSNSKGASSTTAKNMTDVWVGDIFKNLPHSFLIIVFWEFFIFSGHKVFIRCVILKYFLPLFVLVFILITVFFYKEKFKKN